MSALAEGPGETVVAVTPRLRLRRLRLDDAVFYCRVLNEPSFLQNIGDRGVRTPADAEQYLRTRTFAAYEQLGFGMYLMESRADAAPVGLCGLVKRDTLPEVDLGFALLPEFWGRGYAFEAAAAVLAHARGDLGLERLLAIVAPHNQRSSSLLERLGFRYRDLVTLTPGAESLKLYEIALADAAPAPPGRA